ncbi:hypothetical protein C8T65DRAFT_102722 [Cerioporus squamosus]|nr:hypothetical protein C8T65DRAFT_102722 [Cerioporus squamosus]
MFSSQSPAVIGQIGDSNARNQGLDVVAVEDPADYRTGGLGSPGAFADSAPAPPIGLSGLAESSPNLMAGRQEDMGCGEPFGASSLSSTCPDLASFPQSTASEFPPNARQPDPVASTANLPFITFPRVQSGGTPATRSTSPRMRQTSQVASDQEDGHVSDVTATIRPPVSPTPVEDSSVGSGVVQRGQEPARSSISSQQAHLPDLFSVTDWDQYRDAKEIRGGDDETVWYRTSGRFELCQPPSSLLADVDDIFIHVDERTSRAKLWVFTNNSVWIRIRPGDKRPSDPSRRLNIQRNGDPSWVTKETWSVYRSRRKRRVKAGRLVFVHNLDWACYGRCCLHVFNHAFSQLYIVMSPVQTCTIGCPPSLYVCLR